MKFKLLVIALAAFVISILIVILAARMGNLFICCGFGIFALCAVTVALGGKDSK